MSFSIKRLYTRPDVVEITIYHKAHTRIDGSFAHGEHDSEYISRMSRYAPCMSQALKDHIWAQLNLGYTTKQIYDKHKAIWWERVNADQSITQHDFIQLQDIAYLDRKHKKGSWRLHTNPAISIRSWALQHSKDVFFFQDVGEINGTQVPFTIGIQTPTQCKSVLIWSQWCHFYGCHIWHKWHEIPSIHLDGVWWSSHGCPFSLDHYK